MTTALIIIITYAGSTIQTHSVTVHSPSETIFKNLSIRYPSTLSCRCTETSIHHHKFLSFDPQYHPICTSQFLNHSFISALSKINIGDYYRLDYRIIVSSHFQLLALLCETIKQMMDDSLFVFNSKRIMTTQVLSIEKFDAQINQLVKQLKSTIIADMKHTSDHLELIIFQNGIYSALRTNYLIQYNPDSDIYSHFPNEYNSLSANCSCIRNATCMIQAEFYYFNGYSRHNFSTADEPVYIATASRLFTVPGMMVGCSPYSTILQSSLKCFYSQSCIQQLQIFIHGFSSVSPLSSSLFQPNTTVEYLLNELFIESWNEKRNFDNYFNSCSPLSCTYTYDRRFNLLYIIMTIIGLFSGAQMAMFLIAPFIVNIIRRCQKCKHQSNTTENLSNEIELETNSNQSLKDRLMSLVKLIKMKLLTLNMFPYLSEITDGIYSTRVYLLTFVVGIIILVFYASISVQIRSITVYQPSLNKYEQLYRRYSRTLVCPCTRLSIPYSSIIDIVPHYHQVCSSDFIKDDAWLLYFTGTFPSFHTFDFRGIGMELFSLLQTLCRMSNETVINELFVFNHMEFISSQVVAFDLFEIQTSALIRQFQQQTVDSFLGLFELVRALIQLNQFIVVGSTNAEIYHSNDNNNTMHYFKSTQSYDNDCSCGKSTSCTRPQGFYCTKRNCKGNSAKPNHTIPSMVLSCLPVDSLLASSLQCLYNTSCLQMIIRGRSFETNASKIDPRAANITPLNPRFDRRSSPNTTLDNIVSRLFIEDWTNTTNFSSYYHQCAPDECTYTYEQRFNRVYIVATVCGIIGGLSVALKIFIPLLVTLLQPIYHVCRRRRLVQVPTEVTVETKQLQTADQILVEQRQQIATRFYVIFVLIALLVIIIFSALNLQIHLITISTPTLSTFESLQDQYPSSLSCPCSQITIQYSTFATVEPKNYHQVCSSYFITPDFISLLWGSDEANAFLFDLDRKILSTEFRLLSTLCSLAINTTRQHIKMFSSRELISVETLTRHSFQTQINSIMNSFIVETPARFRRIHKYIIEMFRANQLPSMFLTNWNLRSPSLKDGYYMLTSPALYNESGLVIGCLPAYGLRLSTLECFYNSTCLERLATFLNSSYVLPPLNISLYSRFTPISSTTIGTLIDELFIETWYNTSNYSSYFSSCTPLTCHYSYEKRNSVLYMIITYLGLFGGLTVGLKYVVWYGLCLYWKVRQLCTNVRNRIEPININD
ncbi:unnamed protein product [Adineta steineri]|uniref:Uncharacterized protein n=1 Tax=Adineta steineri TaxID=433720 RepID=A0A814ZBC9_9BILA|nr:unnamed protein product [Adineta steineri]CAF1115754.1 unnamed protein product [Adineta steineri]CAF1242907.1 unnamed protein product [Adineta steineri]CAF1529152.1 unnamed protein product [Adineta steineri]